MKQHNFKASLHKSIQTRDAQQWEQIYRRYWPDLIQIVFDPDNLEAQLNGIDTTILLPGGNNITVDEKEREKDYGDILLEYWSARETQTKGWVCKDSKCDFIAYLIKPTGICHLLSCKTLKKVWAKNGQKWLSIYQSIEVSNKNNTRYTTVNVIVPTGVLLREMRLVESTTNEGNFAPGRVVPTSNHRPDVLDLTYSNRDDYTEVSPGHFVHKESMALYRSIMNTIK